MLLRTILASSIFLSSSAFAQQSGTPAEQRACHASVQRFCTKVVGGGDMAILGCLQQNRAKLTSACRQVLVDHGV